MSRSTNLRIVSPLTKQGHQHYQNYFVHKSKSALRLFTEVSQNNRRRTECRLKPEHYSISICRSSNKRLASVPPNQWIVAKFRILLRAITCCTSATNHKNALPLACSNTSMTPIWNIVDGASGIESRACDARADASFCFFQKCKPAKFCQFPCKVSVVVQFCALKWVLI